MQRILQNLPEAEPDEALFLDSLLKGKTDEDLKNFIYAYRTKRKDSQTILFTALLGFVLAAGIHRFLLNQIGMGILYLFTGGLCGIGTIIDLINHKTLTLEYNKLAAEELHSMMK